MKSIKRLLGMLLLTGTIIFLATPPAARAADYAIQKTFINVPVATFSTTTVSNLNQAVDVTQFTDFLLVVRAVSSSAVAGAAVGVDVRWDSSGDGIHFINSTNQLMPSVQGQFTMPLSGAAAGTNTFVTNITANALGYWRITSISNSSAVTFTNIQITAYVKPKRTNRDF